MNLLLADSHAIQSEAFHVPGTHKIGLISAYVGRFMHNSRSSDVH